jgi:hypothetical protein
VRSRIARADLLVPDQVFGLAWSGTMTSRRLAALIANRPSGLTEIYLHPATRDDYPGHAPGYAYAAEYAALIDAGVCRAAAGIPTGSFADFGRRDKIA